VRLPSEEKLWLLTCLLGSFVALFFIYIVRIKHLAHSTSLLGEHLQNRPFCALANTEQIQKARRIGHLMRLVSKHVPWYCACLSEAICVKWLLNRLGIPSVFYLGAKIDSESDKGVKAHAWVSVGPSTIVGALGHRDFSVVAVFTTLSFKSRYRDE